MLFALYHSTFLIFLYKYLSLFLSSPLSFSPLPFCCLWLVIFLAFHLCNQHSPSTESFQLAPICNFVNPEEGGIKILRNFFIKPRTQESCFSCNRQSPQSYAGCLHSYNLNSSTMEYKPGTEIVHSLVLEHVSPPGKHMNFIFVR